jgi:hypothetical protein
LASVRHAGSSSVRTLCAPAVGGEVDLAKVLVGDQRIDLGGRHARVPQ